MKKFVCILLSLTLVIFPFNHVKAGPTDSVVRIGLFYGSNDLVAANLQNYTGGGYRFGYLTSDKQFVEVGRSSEVKITMIKNWNVYLSNNTYSETDPGSSKLVGGYHETTGVVYNSVDEANTVAAELRASGKAAFVCYDNGSWKVRISSYASNNGDYVTGSKYAISIVITGTNDIIFQFDGGENTHLVVMPDITGIGEPQTWFKNNKYTGGFEYRRVSGNNLSVFSVVTMQQYVKGIIPYEMSSSWPLEALKAQAVCARTYTAFNLGRHKSQGFDLCNDIHCQVYKGCGDATDATNRAVDETNGVYLTYGGNICNTVYHASDGGATEDSGNVWTTNYPYLKGVYDPYEDASKIPRGTWTYTHTNDSLTKLLTAKGYTNAGVVDCYIEKFTGMGNVYTLTLLDKNNTPFRFSKEQARTFLGNTHSQRYTINGDSGSLALQGGSGSSNSNSTDGLYVVGSGGVVAPITKGEIKIISGNGVISGVPTTTTTTANGVYVVNGRGDGHNVGMSQQGTKGMAEQNFTYDQILKFYFSGVTLDIR